MDNENFKRKFEDVDKEMLEELQHELEEEMKKPHKKWNDEKISELSKAIYEICENEDIPNKDAKKAEILNKISVPNIIYKRKKIYKRMTVAAVSISVVLGLNAISLASFGQNIFSSVYELTKNSVIIDIKNGEKQEIIELPANDNDPYGIRAKCAEYGFEPKTPHYLPEGFELSVLSEHEYENHTSVSFFYKKRNIKLNIYYDYYYDIDNENLRPGFPTDTYNIAPEEINGHVMHILKEDNQFSCIFLEQHH